MWGVRMIIVKLKGRPEKDRWGIGYILMIRRKIYHLCENEGHISKQSVIRILDASIPESIVEQEKRRIRKNKRRRRQNDKKTTNK